jgi:CHAT domain-containing protein
MGPLIETFLRRLQRPAHRPYRLVLVPMGDLARIPWQAARRPDGRYAVELAAISQAASARMLCRSAALPEVAPSPTGLVVGDPDTTDPETGRHEVDLVAARLEAYAIRQAFYPGARFVGRGPDGASRTSGAGTAAEVREWLTAAGPVRGSMLHLACHGYVRTEGDRPGAHLALAGGERLTAEELVAVMGSAPERAVGLVVLAACRTGLSMNGYDEAYSLGTAFLAGGARSVLSTQWSIPDRATSVLMFMFHHYLRSERRPAWAALRQAQLWMLEPDRAIPDGMPATLRAGLSTTGLRDVVAWAGFIHWGQ